VYTAGVGSFRSTGLAGSAIPRVLASVRMNTATILDLHFYFLNLEDHPCESSFGGQQLTAERAQSKDTFFDDEFLFNLRGIFTAGHIVLGELTYHDILDAAKLDALDVADAGELLARGEHATGINVFFVRSLSPAGLQAFAPNPGPVGQAGTRQSGIVIGLDTLCYRTWTDLARLTAHELARYMGLQRNVEFGASAENNWRDNISDSLDNEQNLMFYSEFGGFTISAGQIDILTRSGVLR
jgi:hypothetical protein